MATPVERALALVRRDDFFMDDLFSEMERDIARMHHDLRGSMTRLNPIPFLSSGKDLAEKAQQLRDTMAVDKDGVPQLDLTMDMSAFKPDEIEVVVKGNSLKVNAVHEENHGRSYAKTVFSRAFDLPEGTDLNAIHPKLSKDGVLTIKGPLPLESAKSLPITQDE